MKNKTLKMIYLVAFVALIIAIAFHWADVQAGFKDGWNNAP